MASQYPMTPPISPQSNHGAPQTSWDYNSTPAGTLSPTSTAGYSDSREGIEVYEKSEIEQQRERGAAIKAMALLNKNEGGQVYKSENAQNRERGAAIKAMALLNKNEGGQVYKSENSQNHERGVTMKAMTLLDRNFGADHKETEPQGATTARQAASQRYNQKKKEKKEAKAFIYEMKNGNPAPGVTKKLTVEKGLEKMATSSRKVNRFFKATQDPETVAGMKCQLDLDKEKEATRKALNLLVLVSENGGEGFEIIC
jgi:hypothetical protein